MNDWVPSPSRTVTVAAQRVIRGLTNTPIPLAFPAKAPSDCLDFSLDLSLWLDEISDSIVGASATWPDVLADTDLAVLWVTIVEQMIVIFLGGGQPNTSVAVRVNLSTQDGRRHTEQILVVINGNSAAVVPIDVSQLLLPAGGLMPIAPNAIALPDGTILTDSDGLPFIFA